MMNNELQFDLFFAIYFLAIQGSDPTRITTRAKLQTRRCKLNQVIHITLLSIARIHNMMTNKKSSF